MPSQDRPSAESGDAIVSIDESCRADFELSWMTGQRRSIEHFLPAADDPRFLATLEELVSVELELIWRACDKARDATVVERLHQTVTPPKPHDVEQYCERFPILQQTEILSRIVQQEFVVRRRFHDQPTIGEYQTRFPELDMSAVLSDEALACSGAAYEESTSASGQQPETAMPTIDGYELLERIGTGGMGVVYRARQLAADRIVAIKLLRTDRLNGLSPEARQATIDRLSVEAQATARLDHPNVVSLFEVNVDDPGQPWFSMQLVEGVTLADHLAEGPVDSRAAATLMRQVADGIVSAHDKGVLHRDLKPQNIFLRQTDQHVLVGDFGLAKLRLDDARRTSQDDILGTPAYMAPEQIRDSARVTELADIWSMGATLYHSLIGRPPFQAASAMDTMRQVLDHEPIAPRQLNPAVDRDLETICVKCLQEQPAQRYASAQALLDDLNAYLDGRPISARPVGTLERVWRWCHRNPRPATLAAIAVAGVLLAFAGLVIGYRTANDALEQSAASLTRVRAAQEESAASHELARHTVDDLFTEVSETVLLNKPGMQPLRRRLLERTLNYYRRFAQSGRHSQTLQSELGRVWYRIGLIEEELGRQAAADDAFGVASQIQHRLTEAEASVENRADLSLTLNAIGTFRLRQQQWDDARNYFEQALRIRDRLVIDRPDHLEFHRLRANTVMNLGAVERNVGLPNAAISRFRTAAELHREVLAQLSPGDTLQIRIQRELAKALFNLANAAIDAAIDPESSAQQDVHESLIEATRLFEDVLTQEPDSYPDRRRYALCLQLRVEWEDDPAAAALLAEQATEQLQRLVAENRRVPELVVELAQVELLSGRLAVDGDQYARARVLFSSAWDRLAKLPSGASVKRDRDMAVLKAERALAETALGSASSSDTTREALAEIRKQLALSAGDEELLDLQRQILQARQNLVL
jgi:eukaryotic-like serine/threonine-protein kinase